MCLSPGEIDQGMYITVLEWYPETETLISITGTMVERTQKETALLGTSLKVIAVAPPYVKVVGVEDDLDDDDDEYLTLDTRKCSFMELPESFVYPQGKPINAETEGENTNVKP